MSASELRVERFVMQPEGRICGADVRLPDASSRLNADKSFSAVTRSFDPLEHQSLLPWDGIVSSHTVEM